MDIKEIEDHPRVCGEQSVRWRVAFGCLGSSPRVRGTAKDLVIERPEGGIIPACAGNSPVVAPPASVRRDHPRVCGEQLLLRQETHPVLGSSPRVRGTVKLKGDVRGSFGIIPACAGNSSSLTVRNSSHGDHPRVCGEQLF